MATCFALGPGEAPHGSRWRCKACFNFLGPPHGAAQVPRPPLPFAEAQDEVHAFLLSRRVTAMC